MRKVLQHYMMNFVLNTRYRIQRILKPVIGKVWAKRVSITTMRIVEVPVKLLIY